MMSNNKYVGTAQIRQRTYASVETTSVGSPPVKKTGNIKLEGIDVNSLKGNLFHTTEKGFVGQQKGGSLKPEADSFAMPLAAKARNQQKSVGAAPVWEGYNETDTPALSVEQILEKIRSKHKKKIVNTDPNNPDSPGIKMIGKSKYLLPNNQTLRESLKGSMKTK